MNKIPHRHKLHQQYFLKSGQEVPGGSTIAGLRDKGMGMVGSAVKLTKAGYDYKKVWKDKQDIGTVAHGLILQDLTGKRFYTDEYSPKVVEQANWSMKSYFAWKAEHNIEIVECECEYVSERLKSGGTMDLIARIDGLLTLNDYKTGGLYESAYIQVGGYDMIYEENKCRVDQLALLNIPRNEDESFRYVILTEQERTVYRRIYERLNGIYWDEQELKIYKSKED